MSCETATAVETQLSEMNAIKERIKTEKQKWIRTINSGYVEIQVSPLVRRRFRRNNTSKYWGILVYATLMPLGYAPAKIYR